MIVPDVNLLLYAYDSASPQFDAAKSWWEDVLSDSEPVGIPGVVILGFTRIATHRSICSEPLEGAKVGKIVESWLDQPNVELLVAKAATFRRFFELFGSVGSVSSLATDALIAAQALEVSGTVYSNDRDFGKFPGLKWVNPLA